MSACISCEPRGGQRVIDFQQRHGLRPSIRARLPWHGRWREGRSEERQESIQVNRSDGGERWVVAMKGDTSHSRAAHLWPQAGYWRSTRSGAFHQGLLASLIGPRATSKLSAWAKVKVYEPCTPPPRCVSPLCSLRKKKLFPSEKRRKSVADPSFCQPRPPQLDSHPAQSLLLGKSSIKE